MPSLTESADTREGSAPRVPAGDCEHRLHVVGYVRPAEHTRLDCQQPLRVVCSHGCGHEEFWRCNCTAEARCAPCSERKRRLLARIIDHGLSDRSTHGHTYFLTLTAPGHREHRQWRQGRGGTDRPECSCHLHGLSQGRWNAGESACWNRLRLSLARATGGLAYIGAVEVQDRGALHRHVVLHSPQVLTPDQVQALALAAGYGCVMDLQVLTTPAKAAWYVSKYVTKSAGQRGEVPWEAEVVDLDTGEVRMMKTTATFRTWSAAQTWGFTMKGLRELMRLEARARARYLRELEALLAEDGHPPVGIAAAACQVDCADPPPG